MALNRPLKDGTKQQLPPKSIYALRNNEAKHRLLYLVGQFDRGGLERQLFYLLRTMDREFYKPAVAVWNYREEDLYVPHLKQLGVPLYSFSRDSSSMAKLLAFRRLARQLQPEVIHSYSFYTNFPAYWGARATGAIPIGSIRSEFNWARTESGPILGRISARWPSNQICNSYSALQSVKSSQGPFVPKSVSVVHNGVDLEEFRSFPFQSNGPVRILGIGYLLPVKRWSWLLQALEKIKSRGLNCLARIAGDGPLASLLEQQAHDLGVSDRVEFLGHTDDIALLLAQASFVVHTAESEGCPNAIMEAMACGRAVVATNAGDIPLLVETGKSGFVVGRDDHAALVERIVELITGGDLYRAMGEAARKKAEREFGLQRLTEDTLAAYRRAGWRET